MSSKLAFLGDAHIGARADSLNFHKFFRKFYTNTFFPYLKEHNIKKVIQLGDLFDRRKYANFQSLHEADEYLFSPLKEEDIIFYTILGNHDTYFKNTNDVNSPNLLLRGNPNIKIISSPETRMIEGFNFCFVPWICQDNYDETLEVITESRAEFCIGHLEIEGFSMYRGMDSYGGISRSIFKKFDSVFTGHFHHRHSQDNIHYLGTPYEITLQDFGDLKGFHTFDLDTRELEFIPNPYSIYSRIEYNDASGDNLTINPDDVKDKYVRVVVINKTDYYKFDTFMNTVYSLGAHDVKIIEDGNDLSSTNAEEQINLEDTLSILTKYVNGVQSDLGKDKINNYMKSLYLEALSQEV